MFSSSIHCSSFPPCPGKSKLSLTLLRLSDVLSCDPAPPSGEGGPASAFKRRSTRNIHTILGRLVSILILDSTRTPPKSHIEGADTTVCNAPRDSTFRSR